MTRRKKPMSGVEFARYVGRLPSNMQTVVHRFVTQVAEEQQQGSRDFLNRLSANGAKDLEAVRQLLDDVSPIQ